MLLGTADQDYEGDKAVEEDVTEQTEIKLDYGARSLVLNLRTEAENITRVELTPRIPSHRVPADQLAIYVREGIGFTKLDQSRWKGVKDNAGKITVTFTPLLQAAEIKIHCNYDDLDILQLPVDRAEFYNAPEQLATVYQKLTSRTETYQYDAMGNRTVEQHMLQRQHVYTYEYYSHSNRLKSNGRYNYEYDANGNLIRKAKNGGSEVWEYAYDLFNQLVEVTKNGAVVSSYIYDPTGFRVQKTGSNGSIHYVQLLNGEVGYKKELTGGKETSYIYVGIQHLARVDGVIGGPGKKYYYHNDHLGSGLSITDEEGNKVMEREFAPFGEKIHTDLDDEEGMVDPAEDASGFTGKDWDEDIGLYYYNARWYDPEIGRFITEDSVNDPNNPNVYVYGANNPVINIDPSGHWVVNVNWNKFLNVAASKVISYALSQIPGYETAMTLFSVGQAATGQLRWANYLKMYTSMNEEDFKQYLAAQGIEYDFDNTSKKHTHVNSDGQKRVTKASVGAANQMHLTGDQKLAALELIQGNIKTFLENNPGLNLEQVKGIYDSAVISVDNPWGFGKNEFRYEGRGSNYNGLYDAEAVIMNEGMVEGVFTRASTLPDPGDYATVNEGIYNYKVGRHHQGRHATEIGQPAPKDENGNYYTYTKTVWNKKTKKFENIEAPIDNWKKGAYKALRFQGLIPSSYNGKAGNATDIISHVGYFSEKGSHGCMTTYGDDYQSYINLFEWGDSGKFVIIR